MIEQDIIEEVKKRLIQAYGPLEIYLFGSYAWGSPDEESDLDLLIVVDELNDTRHKMKVAGHRALRNVDVSKDILVYTREEFEARAHDITTLGYKIKQEGKLIYAKA